MKKKMSVVLLLVMILNMTVCFGQTFSNTVAAETTFPLPYEPEKWNDGDYIQNSNNCYSYALNRRFTSCEGLQLQPGELSDHLYVEYVNSLGMARAIEKACEQDAIACNGDFIKCYDPDNILAGHYAVALVINSASDYHWYRKNNDGTWSHKLGDLEVTNLDASGDVIYYPSRVNTNYAQYGGINYDTFVGYYMVGGGYVGHEGELNFDASTGTITGYSYAPTGEVELPSQINGVSVQKIGIGAFAGYRGITYMTIPDSVTDIKTQAFLNCQVQYIHRAS